MEHPENTFIILSKGVRTLVDREIAEGLGKRRWWANVTVQRKTYAIGRPNGRSGGLFYLHRLIIGAMPGQIVDHVNGNSLDNRRANLRLCDRSGNAASRALATGPSGYRGVYRDRRRWRAMIHSGAKKSLGTFDTAISAALAYDAAARVAFGEFAIVNFPAANENAAADFQKSQTYETLAQTEFAA